MVELRLTLFLGLCCLVHISFGEEAASTVMTVSPSLTTSLLPFSTASMTTVPISTPSVTATPTVTPTPVPASSSEFLLSKEDSNGTETVCAHVTATIELAIKYKDTVTSKKNTHDISVNDMFPAVDGNMSVCGDKVINMTLAFFNSSDYAHFVTFQFKRDKDDSKWYGLDSIIAHLDMEDTNTFPGFDTNITDNITGYTTEDDGIFSVDRKKSYECKTSQRYDMETVPKLGEDVIVMSVKLTNFQAQAFEFKNNTTGAFDSRSSCSADHKSSKIVPIAVGAALAGLVVVVLIAYLIGRFRSRKQSSYEALS